MVGYIEETPPKVKLDKICNEIQVHSHVHSLWGEFALYIMVILTSHAFVAFDVSTTGFWL